jgi:hypothetical protein
MEDRLVTVWGIQGVPDILREDVAFTPRAHRATMQVLAGEARRSLRLRLLEERRKKDTYIRVRCAVQKTSSTITLKF